MSSRSPFVQVASTTTKLALLLIIATTLGNATVINGTSVAGNRLKIVGAGFSGAPTVIFNGAKLAIDNNTDTHIVATLDPVPNPGTYRLVVKAGATSAVSYVEISKNPRIVKQVALTGQTGSIPTTTLLTPRANGLYRVSAYVTAKFQTNNGNIDFSLGWTDDNNVAPCVTNSVSPPCLTIPGAMRTTPLYDQGVFIVRAVAGTPITYSIESLAVDPPAIYDLFITVEQLQ